MNDRDRYHMLEREFTKKFGMIDSNEKYKALEKKPKAYAEYRRLSDELNELWCRLAEPTADDDWEVF